LRSQKKKKRIFISRVLWLIGISICLPIGSLFTVVEFGPPTSMYCLLRYLQSHLGDSSNTTQTGILPIAASFYWLGFVLFLYALPLTIIVILYGLMLKFLRGARGQSVGKSKRRATRMILAVILTYALCWFFMQLLFISNILLSRNTSHHFATYMDILTTCANVFAYLNSVCCIKKEFERKLISFSLVYKSNTLWIYVKKFSFIIY
jgi:hypothetical protein